VCIQETKLQRIDASTVASFLGQEFAKNITVLPAQGTRGVLACSGSPYVMSQVVIKEYSMTATITSTADNTVYGPQDTAEKQQFMQELQQCKPTIAARWIFMGDFNLIYRACDKSNQRVNRRLMSSFRSVPEDLEIKELQLHGWWFTWSSGTATPTLSKIDHVFISKEWELANPNCYLQALPDVDHVHPTHQVVQGRLIRSQLVANARLQRCSAAILNQACLGDKSLTTAHS
jgi:hypothetical protein